ncbi:hypothetical protein BgiMline_021987 [Biomphalaria glabrata]|uniref:Uncharacterized protein LOC106060831 n=1 Tax=Biomphalaria glabrata TaxID=6526 RepID=A0A2C9JN67_BIOGL|nr:uncharacterized protein LOC106060831 [Biomphalaria glabrata]
MAGVQCLRFLGRQHCHTWMPTNCFRCSVNKYRSIDISKRNVHDHILKGKVVKIGCASGFWGDTACAAPQLIYGAKLNYIIFDYLSEITMSLLTAGRRKSPDMGYAPDFVQVSVAPFIKDIKTKGVKLISNAGGINPSGCAEALHKVCRSEGVDLKIAVIKGDDLMSQVQELRRLGITDMHSGEPFPEAVHSMNAYLGAGPIAQALSMGADIVITGRCADSAMALAPLIHEFDWKMDQFDLMAAGSLAGHLIECGAQVTGGIFTDWHLVEEWDHIGFPIVSVGSDGRFTVSKPSKTGGLVNRGTVAEQLLYEVGDPAQYFLPDVVCDFTQVGIDELPSNMVYVEGARGTPPSGEYKVSATYATGYRSTAACIVGGPRADEKAEKTAKSILTRCRRIFHQLNMSDFSAVNVEVIGRDRRTDEQKRPDSKVLGPKDALLWMAVTHKDRKALEFFSREIAPAGTGMAPGLCGIIGGRPKVSPVLKLFSFLHPRNNFKITIEMDGKVVEYIPPNVPTAEYLTQAYPASDCNGKAENKAAANLPKGEFSYRLEELAFTRSGDKGNDCNIGVIARHPAYLPFIRAQLTAEAVESFFISYFKGSAESSKSRVQRYDVPGVSGLNFVLKGSLGGGGIASLRSDPQGKAMGQELLDFRIKDVPNLKKLAKDAVVY